MLNPLSITPKKRRCKKLWSNGLVRRKKSTPSNTKDSNGAESDDGEDDEEDEENVKTAERDELEQELNESEQMEVENKENRPTSTEDRRKIPEAVHSHNGHVSSAEEDCTDSSLNGIQNGKSSPGILAGENKNSDEVRLMDHLRDKRVENGAEEDAGIDKGIRRMTRGLKSQARKLIDVSTAIKILEQKNQQVIVDHKKLKDLLQKVVNKTEGYEVDRLEKLYARLCQSIYRHRKIHDKTALVQEMTKEVEEFS